MKNFISALGFLTILPVPKDAFRNDGRQILYFPLVGLLLGALLCGVDKVCSLFMYPELKAIVDVFFLAIITGAFHLDGLADSADGLFSHRSREKALEIMKDSRTGVMGALALIFCLLLKIAGVYGLQGSNYAVWLIAAPAYARAGQVVGLVFMDYARKDQGNFPVFFQKGKYSLLALCLLPVALPFYLGPVQGIAIFALFAGLTLSMLYFFKKQLGGATGDTLGAMTEITETFILIAGALVCMNR